LEVVELYKRGRRKDRKKEEDKKEEVFFGFEGKSCAVWGGCGV
jgi:hypothetical protein